MCQIHHAYNIRIRNACGFFGYPGVCVRTNDIEMHPNYTGNEGLYLIHLVQDEVADFFFWGGGEAMNFLFL